MSRLALACLVWTLAVAAPPAHAQDMNLALSRLDRVNDRLTNDVDGDGVFEPADGDTFADGNGNGAYDPCLSSRGTPPGVCQDDDAYRRVMTQFAGAMIPPVLTPAGTRGVRGIYAGFETWLTGIDSEAGTPTGDAWHRAVEGDGGGTDPTRSRFTDTVLAWGRFNVRKGLPFGFDLGASIGWLANTTYWTLGLEVRWALFEGFRDGVGWLPDVAVRGAVQTMLGDGEFNVTVPTVDLILSEPIVVASTVEIVPYVVGQVGFVFVDSELVDLTPEAPSFPACNPDPRTPSEENPSAPTCRGEGAELNNNIVFPSLRSTRLRAGAGLQIRYEWVTFLGAFMFDATKPSDLDDSLPDDLGRQWQVDLGLGVTL